MSAFWKWLTGAGQAKSRRLREAEASMTQDELQAVKQHFQRFTGQNKAGVLPELSFLHELCGWPVPSPQADSSHMLLGRALFRTCCGYSTRDAEATAGDPVAGLGWAWGDDGDTPDSGGTTPQRPAVTSDDVLVAKAVCEHLGVDEANAFALELCARVPYTSTATGARADASGQLLLTPDQLRAAVTAAVSLLCAVGCLPASSCTPPASTTPEPDAAGVSNASRVVSQLSQPWVDAVVQGALWSAAGPAAAAPAVHLDCTGYSRWARGSPGWHTVLTSLLSAVGTTLDTAPSTAAPFALDTSQQAAAWGSGESIAAQQGGHVGPGGRRSRLRLPQCPQLVLATARGSTTDLGSLAGSTLLHPLAALVLSHNMPPAHRKEWRLVFNSQKDGKSFNTLMGRLTTVEGATLILVKEAGEGGHLVAGFAAASWRKQGSFFGDHSTWVARLLPGLQVFTSTGANTNFQWCGQGFSQLTNGIGFGGAQGSVTAFGLLLDSTLDSGHSRPIATFGSPALTKNQVFQVDSVECWLVQTPEPQDMPDKSGKSARSVLDKAGADRVIMDLAGRQVNHSAGLRPEAPIED